MVWSGPWVLVRGVEETGRGHSTGRVGQAPETRIRRVIGRKKCKCVQVKLIELGLCLEIAMDALESFLSLVESPLWAPTLSSVMWRDERFKEVDGWSFERISTTRVIKMSIRREVVYLLDHRERERKRRLANQSRGPPWDGERVWPLIGMLFNRAPNARNKAVRLERKRSRGGWFTILKLKSTKRKRKVLSSKGTRSAIASLIMPEWGRKECRSLARRKSGRPRSLHNILKDLSRQGAISPIYQQTI